MVFFRRFDTSSEPDTGGNMANLPHGDAAQPAKKVALRHFFLRLGATRRLHLMLFPAILYFIVFHYLPMYGILIAFKRVNLRLGILRSPWIGFTNFQNFFSYPFFSRLLINTVSLNTLNLLWSFPIAIVFALLLNEIRKSSYKKIVQTISYLPHFISTVSLVGILFLILSPENGIVNRLIVALGGKPIFFMAESSWFRSLFVASGIWQNMGWDAIIYLAALSGVDMELYEAARIDGANRLQQMLHVTIPSILPTITIMLVLRMGGMMNSNTEKVLLMQTPITYDVSDIIGTYVYRLGLVQADYGMGTAVDLFNSLINICLLVAANMFSRRLTDSSLF